MIDLQSKKETFIDYGYSFQIKLLRALAFDLNFLKQIYDILSTDYFDSESLAFIANTIKNTYSEYKQLVTAESFKIALKPIDDNILKVAVVENLKDIYKNTTDDGLQEIKSEAIKFCYNQNLKNAIFKCAQLTYEQKYDDIKLIWNKAINAGISKELGHNYKEDVILRYKATTRNTKPSGFNIIDNLADGGFGSGELITIVAPPGIGKCVGPNTEIEIQYEEIGIECVIADKTIILWIKPWEQYKLDDDYYYGWQIEYMINYLLSSNGDETIEKSFNLIHNKICSEKIKIKKLFDVMGVEDIADAFVQPKYKLEVKTPYGYNQINCLFRTKEVENVTLYFANNKTLKCSTDHLLRVNNEWKKVKDIIDSELIETKTGVTTIKKIIKHKPQVLYDLEVDKVNCYFSNDILSHNSWWLVAIGAEGLKRGYKVLHYTCELEESYTSRRYDAYLTGYNFVDLKYREEEIIEKMNEVPGELYVKYYPMRTATVDTLIAHTEHMIDIGFIPDIIIVDYSTLLKTSVNPKHMRRDEMHGSIFGELKGMAGRFGIPLYTAQQAGRSAAKENVISGEEVADTYEPIKVSDFVFSISRKLTDKISGTGRILIIKNRFGPDGIPFPFKSNMNNGHINIMEGESIEGRELMRKMDNEEEIIRKKLSQSYKDFNNKNFKNDGWKDDNDDD